MTEHIARTVLLIVACYMMIYAIFYRFNRD